MDGLRFIMENPRGASRGKKKRSRAVTACNACRSKKIKCYRVSPSAKCNSCDSSETYCNLQNSEPYHAKHSGSVPFCCNANSTHPFNKSLTSTHFTTPYSEIIITSRCSSPPSAMHDLNSERSKFTYFCGSPRDDIRQIHPTRENMVPLTPMFPEGSTIHSLSLQEPKLSLEVGPSQSESFFDPFRPNFPSSKYMQYAARLFFDNLGSFFPFLRHHQVLQCASNQTLPALLSNCIVGLAMRFSPSELSMDIPKYNLGDPFINMAKQLLLSDIPRTSLENLHALILLSWCEYGRGHVSDLPLSASYAVQIASDIGLGNDANIQIFGTEQERTDLRSTWWNIVALDIISSWVTGTPALINFQQHTTLHSLDPVYTIPYQLLHGLLDLRNRFLIILNSNQSPSVRNGEVLSIRARLAVIHASLPANLHFNHVNLRHALQEDQHPIFIFLHLVLQSLRIITGYPSLFHPFPGQICHRIDIAIQAAQAISDILQLVDSFDARIISANPFLDYPLAVASRMFLKESGNEVDPLIEGYTMSDQSKTNLHVCTNILAKHTELWGHVKTAEQTVERKLLWCSPLQHISSDICSSLNLLETELNTFIGFAHTNNNSSDYGCELASTVPSPEYKTSPYRSQFISGLSDQNLTTEDCISSLDLSPIITSPSRYFGSEDFGNFYELAAQLQIPHSDDNNLVEQCSIFELPSLFVDGQPSPNNHGEITVKTVDQPLPFQCSNAFA
ncbi:hypothetical protein BD410DRAFT_451287 [Rickenella mellea]|uniref:Zn(2)-C6 fungal-type domain-containing protein n=1 Tax=Rickenella mellea TaxID=50990 RepID=A0A4Y7PV79_9AGAM|nr:hypothetical protein BD410DRAFT_451287 [Rickenella mellea]